MPAPIRRLLPNGTKELRRHAAAMLLYLQSAVSLPPSRFPEFSRIVASSHIDQRAGANHLLALSPSCYDTTMPENKIDRELGFNTRALHHGYDPDPTTGARAVPIYQSTSFV